MDEKPRKKGILPALLLIGMLAFVSLFTACKTGDGQKGQDMTSLGAGTTSPADGTISSSAGTTSPDSNGRNEEPSAPDTVVTHTVEPSDAPSQGGENPGAPSDILLATMNGVRYYLRQWSEEDAKREEYEKGGSNYPFQWLGKLMREENGTISELDALVDYDAVAEEGLVEAGDRLIYRGSAGYDSMDMKSMSYISISLDGTDRRAYDDKPYMTSRVLADNGSLYFETYEGTTNDNQYPRLIMRMTPEFEQVEEVAKIEGMLVAVVEGKAYYIANDRVEKPGIYELDLENGAVPRLYDKLGVACSTSHWSVVMGVKLEYDMVDRVRYQFQFQEELGETPLNLNLEIRKEFDRSTLEVFSGPAMVKGNVVTVFAEESGGRFRRLEPLYVAMPAGLKIATGQYVEVYYNGNVMETYPSQVGALSVDLYDNPAFLHLPESMSAEEAARRGFYTTVDNTVVANEDSLQEFAAAVSQPFPAFLRKVSYESGEAGGYVVDVYYDGEKFEVMEGMLTPPAKEEENLRISWMRRAGYGEEAVDHPLLSAFYDEDTLKNLGGKTALARTFCCLHTFENGERLVLSNEENLTEQEWRRRMFSSDTADLLDYLIIK